MPVQFLHSIPRPPFWAVQSRALQFFHSPRQTFFSIQLVLKFPLLLSLTGELATAKYHWSFEGSWLLLLLRWCVPSIPKNTFIPVSILLAAKDSKRMPLSNCPPNFCCKSVYEPKTYGGRAATKSSWHFRTWQGNWFVKKASPGTHWDFLHLSYPIEWIDPLKHQPFLFLEPLKIPQSWILLLLRPCVLPQSMPSSFMKVLSNVLISFVVAMLSSDFVRCKECWEAIFFKNSITVSILYLCCFIVGRLCC